jgi:hypothetical protein
MALQFHKQYFYFGMITLDQVADRSAPLVRDAFSFRNIIKGTAYEKETTW